MHEEEEKSNVDAMTMKKVTMKKDPSGDNFADTESVGKAKKKAANNTSLNSGFENSEDENLDNLYGKRDLIA